VKGTIKSIDYFVLGGNFTKHVLESEINVEISIDGFQCLHF